MDFDLLKAVHKKAMSFESNNPQNIPGKIRTQSNNLTANSKAPTLRCGINGSINGYRQFIQDWFIDRDNPNDFLLGFKDHFCTPPPNYVMITNYNKDSEKFKVMYFAAGKPLGQPVYLTKISYLQ